MILVFSKTVTICLLFFLCTDLLQDGIPVSSLQDTRAHKHHRVLGLLEALHELLILQSLAQVSSTLTQVGVGVSQVHVLPDDTHVAAFEGRLAYPAQSINQFTVCVYRRHQRSQQTMPMKFLRMLGLNETSHSMLFWDAKKFRF